ncbi:MAG: (5-formylfuran-3-yl)methyl phosphate synthase [Pseudomonadota bacterium]
MTRLLASVRSRAEAEVALEGGADIIDLKDPDAGALGAVAPEVMRETLAAVAGRRLVSATAGNLPMDPDVVRQGVEAVAATGIELIKIGLTKSSRTGACIDALAGTAERGVRLVAVLFADRAPDFDLIDAVAPHFFGVMLDTAGKDGRGLREHLAFAALEDFVARAQGAGLFVGLAGSLKLEDVAPLTRLWPDYLGFRGALTGGGRGDEIDNAALRALRDELFRATNPLDVVEGQ